MSRHTLARLLAAVLTVAGLIALAVIPTPYVIFKPGPTVNVLGKYDGHQVIKISGHESYRDDGELRMTTIVVNAESQTVNLGSALIGWLRPDQAVYPREVIFKKTDTNESVQQENAVQMVSSQDAAVAAALAELQIPVTSVVKIMAVQDGGPSDGLLKVGDVVLSANGVEVKKVDDLTGSVQAGKVGDIARLVVRRAGKEVPVSIKTVAASADPKRPVLQVTVGRGYRFPFEVDLGVGDGIGGPSGGLMFALGIYDLLTPGSLTHGKDLAGTGEIDSTGTVGGIGGIQQKIVGAQRDGARLFLVPAPNCEEAVRASYDKSKIRLVKVATLKDAVSAVEAWGKDASATLPTCPR